MAAVATNLTSHLLTMDSEADAEGEIDDQLDFSGQNEMSLSRKASIEISRRHEEEGLATEGADNPPGNGQGGSEINNSAYFEAMPNGQLEGAADEDPAVDNTSESEGSEDEDGSSSGSDEGGSAAAAAWEAASAEEASLEHATRNNCMYVDFFA